MSAVIRRLLPWLALAAACGGDGTATSTLASTTTEGVATTVAVTTSEAVTTTTAAATTTTVATTTTADTFFAVISTEVPDVFGSPGDPHGSGCVVASGDLLPDGVWFGFAEAYAGGVISLDLACYFTGDAATAARIEDGLPGESDASEYVRNFNPRTYEVSLAADAEVYSIPGTGTFFPQLIPASSWPVADGYFDCPGESCPVWLYVNDGIVTGLVEQFFE